MRSNLKSIFAFTAVACVSLSGVALAGERVAVQSFAATGVEPTVAAVLESSFCSALQDEKIDALCADALTAILQNAQTRAGMGDECGDKEAGCLKGIAQATDARRVVTGEVSRLGDTFLLTITVIDAKSNKVLARVSEKAGKAEALLDKVKPLAKKVAAL